MDLANLWRREEVEREATYTLALHKLIELCTDLENDGFEDACEVMIPDVEKLKTMPLREALKAAFINYFGKDSFYEHI